MRLLVIGAGAIGSYLGGSLGCHGHQVVFIERPEVIASIRSGGIVIYNASGRCILSEFRIVGTLSEALELGPFDAAFFALKSFDTYSVANQMSPYANALPPIVCFQNGVENEEILAEVVGQDKVIAGTVTSAIGRHPEGGIIVERQRGVGIGPGRGGISEALVDAFNRADITARVFREPNSMKWSKMLTNLQANASAAILNMSPAEIFDNPELYRMERAQLLEALAVLRRLTLKVVNLPGTPVQAFAFLVRLPLPAITRRILAKAIGSGRGRKMPSLHIDLHSGRKQSEVDYLNGAVVRYGEKLGIFTPVNRALRDTLVQLTSGEMARDRFDHNPDAFLHFIKNVEKV